MKKVDHGDADHARRRDRRVGADAREFTGSRVRMPCPPGTVASIYRALLDDDGTLEASLRGDKRLRAGGAGDRPRRAFAPAASPDGPAALSRSRDPRGKRGHGVSRRPRDPRACGERVARIGPTRDHSTAPRSEPVTRWLHYYTSIVATGRSTDNHRSADSFSRTIS
jgi:hypothetical protein